jgi:putative Mg2+ transporter-C (MgtC) family protein
MSNLPSPIASLADFFQSFSSGYELRILVNFVLCVLAGIIIGKDREAKGKAAGVSTHCLVISGSMLFTMLSLLINGDPSRIAAQIVTGVGFLGAGIIMKKEDQTIGNLTTAAGIWFSSAIGMAIGFEMYTMACTATAMAFFIFRYLPHFK